MKHEVTFDIVVSVSIEIDDLREFGIPWIQMDNNEWHPWAKNAVSQGGKVEDINANNFVINGRYFPDVDIDGDGTLICSCPSNTSNPDKDCDICREEEEEDD